MMIKKDIRTKILDECQLKKIEIVITIFGIKITMCKTMEIFVG